MKHWATFKLTFADVDAPDCLSEFIASLAEGREAETSGVDYLRSEAIVHYARQSSLLKRTVDVELPQLPDTANVGN